MSRDRLSVTDAMFLRLEAPTTPMNMGVVAIFDGGPLLDDSGRVRVEEFRAAARSNLPKRPRNRQLPTPVPLGLGRPVWVDAQGFELERHIDAVTVAEPTHAAVLDLAAEFIATPFDHSRPLWNYRFVDGLPDGKMAVVVRVHHSVRDGGGGLAAFDSIFTITPEVPTFPPPVPWTAEPQPSRWALLMDALAHQGRHLAKLTRMAARAIRHPKRAFARGRRIARAVGPFVGKLQPVPRLSFNQPAGAQRRLATFGLALDDCKAVRAALGGTVNDVLVAAVAGGVRRLLVSRGECGPGTSVTMACPVSHRAAGDASAGNQTTALTVTVELSEPDPLVRYRQVCAGTSQAKDDDQAADLTKIIELADFVVPAMLGGAARKVHDQEGFNLSVSNLKGPPVPVWLLGARLREIYPFGPLMRYTGITVTALSYDGQLFVGVNADAALLPDLDVFAAGVEAELAELLARST